MILFRDTFTGERLVCWLSQTGYMVFLPDISKEDSKVSCLRLATRLPCLTYAESTGR
jgi:hypothetical protein